MRAFFAILVVVGAAAAVSVSEEEQQQQQLQQLQQQQQLSRASAPLAVNIPTAESSIQNAKNTMLQQERVGATRFFNVFTAPLTSRDYLPMEKFGTVSLLEKPLVVAFKQDNQNEMSAFLLRSGFKTFFNSPDTRYIENYMMTGPKKVGLMLSAARYMDLPEMSMVLPKLDLTSDATLNSMYRLSQESTVVPVMLIVAEERLPATRKNALFDLGEFSFNKDFVKISRDVFPKFLPEVQSIRSIPRNYVYSAPRSEQYVKNIKAIPEPVYVQNYEPSIPRAEPYSKFYTKSAVSRAAESSVPTYETSVPESVYVQNFEPSISRAEPYSKFYTKSAVSRAAESSVPVYETSVPEPVYVQNFEPSISRAEPYSKFYTKSATTRTAEPYGVFWPQNQYAETYSKPYGKSAITRTAEPYGVQSYEFIPRRSNYPDVQLQQESAEYEVRSPASVQVY